MRTAIMLNANKMIELSPQKCVYNDIPLGGKRVPLRSSAISGEMDGRKTKLIVAECSDLLLRGCTREAQRNALGFFLMGEGGE